MATTKKEEKKKPAEKSTDKKKPAEKKSAERSDWCGLVAILFKEL